MLPEPQRSPYFVGTATCNAGTAPPVAPTTAGSPAIVTPAILVGSGWIITPGCSLPSLSALVAGSKSNAGVFGRRDGPLNLQVGSAFSGHLDFASKATFIPLVINNDVQLQRLGNQQRLFTGKRKTTLATALGVASVGNTLPKSSTAAPIAASFVGPPASPEGEAGNERSLAEGFVVGLLLVNPLSKRRLQPAAINGDAEVFGFLPKFFVDLPFSYSFL